MSHLKLRQGDYENSLKLIDAAWDRSARYDYERDIIHILRIKGEILVSLKESEKAEKSLNDVLIRARKANYREEEIPVLIAMAKLNLERNRLKDARYNLEDALELAIRGQYPIYQCDAYNILTNIEMKSKDYDKAKDAAIKAYLQAWCDGPPYSYSWGLKTAEDNLKSLKENIPTDLPKHESSTADSMAAIKI
jgi:tetratricopeptide (TPR) repeat protein